MPIPAALLPPLITAGAQLVGTGAQAIFQGKMNKKQRKWAEGMYRQQRADALADWNMQNEYNSPLAAMERLKEAGINPRTYFTQGMQTEAGTVRSSPVENWNPQTVDWQGGIAAAGSALMQYYDVQIKKAQVDNLKAQNTLLLQDSALKALKQDKEQIDLGELQSGGTIYQNMKETQLQVLQGLLRKQAVETDVMLSRNEREAAASAQSLQEGVERIASLRLGRRLTQGQIDSIRKDNTLKQLDIQLRKQFNIGPGDPLYVRLIALALDKLGITP